MKLNLFHQFVDNVGCIDEEFNLISVVFGIHVVFDCEGMVLDPFFIKFN